MVISGSVSARRQSLPSTEKPTPPPSHSRLTEEKPGKMKSLSFPPDTDEVSLNVPHLSSLTRSDLTQTFLNLLLKIVWLLHRRYALTFSTNDINLVTNVTIVK